MFSSAWIRLWMQVVLSQCAATFLRPQLCKLPAVDVKPSGVTEGVSTAGVSGLDGAQV